MASDPEPCDPVEVVRRGYDALSFRYRGDDDAPVEYAPWTAELIGALAVGARVVDVGCGNGVPLARDLTAAGLRVTGVDVSDVQVNRAGCCCSSPVTAPGRDRTPRGWAATPRCGGATPTPPRSAAG